MRTRMNVTGQRPWENASRSGPGDHGGHGGRGAELNFTGSTYAGGQDSHVGRGTFPQPATARAPKGWTRSDDRILDDVVDRLTRDPDVDVSEVTVQVQQGRAVLEGTVPHRAIKHRIEDLVDGCAGVREIDNRIRVSGRYGDTAV
jgi:hypothetical protein